MVIDLHNARRIVVDNAGGVGESRGFSHKPSSGKSHAALVRRVVIDNVGNHKHVETQEGHLNLLTRGVGSQTGGLRLELESIPQAFTGMSGAQRHAAPAAANASASTTVTVFAVIFLLLAVCGLVFSLKQWFVENYSWLIGGSAGSSEGLDYAGAQSVGAMESALSAEENRRVAEQANRMKSAREKADGEISRLESESQLSRGGSSCNMAEIKVNKQGTSSKDKELRARNLELRKQRANTNRVPRGKTDASATKIQSTFRGWKARHSSEPEPAPASN